MDTMLTVAARDVRPGDQIYNSGAYHPSAAWVLVKEVIVVGDSIKISTHVFDTWKHPREGVAIRRSVR